ncbi:hypothetical protein BKA59DRAFT_390991 [Fusarium tricinctum]|uniref:Zn(2)-C6 fungal-type domain-containing protein n=1 Tax=Fusarium tricinctum TaxID=61284 RepID=A0A8K0WFX7_9HYPO|nr:hypothetical protein BKA59DRAFT_390991 [Fusarium tricinctum]
MTIGIPSAAQSKPFLSSMDDQWGNTSSASIPMVSVMSYQYPPLAPLYIEMGMPPQGFVPPNAVPSQRLSSLSMFNVRDPPPLNQEPDLSIKGVFSTTNGGLLHPAEIDEQLQQMGTVGEKKRNKLGYRRTSVACGQCRRRKVRYITSSSDVQGRCINCIRLKGECSCSPVEQTSTGDSRAKKTSRSSAAVKGKSRPSISDAVKQSRKPIPPFSSSAKASTPIAIFTTEAFPHKMRASSASCTNQNPFAIRDQDLSNWMLADADQSPTSNSGELNPRWRTNPSESPVSSQFSSFASVPLSSVIWTSGSLKSISHRDVDLAWGSCVPLVRSITCGGEPLVIYNPSQHPLMTYKWQFEWGPSALPDIYNTSMSGVIPGFEASTSSSINPAIPLSAGAVPPGNYTAWDQSPPHPRYTFIENQDPYAGG